MDLAGKVISVGKLFSSVTIHFYMRLPIGQDPTLDVKAMKQLIEKGFLLKLISEFLLRMDIPYVCLKENGFQSNCY